MKYLLIFLLACLFISGDAKLRHLFKEGPGPQAAAQTAQDASPTQQDASPTQQEQSPPSARQPEAETSSPSTRTLSSMQVPQPAFHLSSYYARTILQLTFKKLFGQSKEINLLDAAGTAASLYCPYRWDSARIDGNDDFDYYHFPLDNPGFATPTHIQLYVYLTPDSNQKYYLQYEWQQYEGERVVRSKDKTKLLLEDIPGSDLFQLWLRRPIMFPNQDEVIYSVQKGYIDIESWLGDEFPTIQSNFRAQPLTNEGTSFTIRAISCPDIYEQKYILLTAPYDTRLHSFHRAGDVNSGRKYHNDIADVGCLDSLCGDEWIRRYHTEGQTVDNTAKNLRKELVKRAKCHKEKYWVKSASDTPITGSHYIKNSGIWGSYCRDERGIILGSFLLDNQLTRGALVRISNIQTRNSQINHSR